MVFLFYHTAANHAHQNYVVCGSGDTGFIFYNVGGATNNRRGATDIAQTNNGGGDRLFAFCNILVRVGFASDAKSYYSICFADRLCFYQHTHT